MCMTNQLSSFHRLPSLTSVAFLGAKPLVVFRAQLDVQIPILTETERSLGGLSFSLVRKDGHET